MAYDVRYIHLLKLNKDLKMRQNNRSKQPSSHGESSTLKGPMTRQKKLGGHNSDHDNGEYINHTLDGLWDSYPTHDRYDEESFP